MVELILGAGGNLKCFGFHGASVESGSTYQHMIIDTILYIIYMYIDTIQYVYLIGLLPGAALVLSSNLVC